MRRAAILASLFALSLTGFLLSGARSESISGGAINLDRFIGDFAGTCETKGDFEIFRRSIRNRYNYDDKRAPDLNRPNKVVIQNDLRSAFGKASYSYDRESTHVVVPLRGTYLGLKTNSVVFDFGDNNGVWVTSLTFDEPLARVRAKLDTKVREAHRRLQSIMSDMGFYAKIDTFLGRPAIRCNRST